MKLTDNPAVRKAIIPIAGLGTRHFPASHAVKKEMFPVVGADGIARALFHYHLLELEAAGIEEICIIVQPGEDELVRGYLRGPDESYLKRLEKYPAPFWNRVARGCRACRPRLSPGRRFTGWPRRSLMSTWRRRRSRSPARPSGTSNWRPTCWRSIPPTLTRTSPPPLQENWHAAAKPRANEAICAW